MHSSIGKSTPAQRPPIAVIIDRTYPLSVVRSLKKQGAGLLEIRFDLFSQPFEAVCDYARTVRKASGLPLLGTIRETRANRAARLEQFCAIMPLVDAVDIEIDAAIRNRVIALARGKTVIVSEHDFKATPTDRRLAAIAQEAKRAGADIVKIAAHAKSRADVVRMLLFCARSPMPIVGISMGPHGTISRVAAPLFGSLFTYAFIGTLVAPGQLPLKKLAEELNLYYPKPGLPG